MTDEFENVGRLLESLHGRGIYDVAMVDEVFPRYGFTYDRGADLLWFAGTSHRLGARTHAEVIRDIDEDPRGGYLEPMMDEDLLVDAVTLSEVVLALMLPGAPPPLATGGSRESKFRKNVRRIIALEAPAGLKH